MGWLSELLDEKPSAPGGAMHALVYVVGVLLGGAFVALSWTKIPVIDERLPLAAAIPLTVLGSMFAGVCLVKLWRIAPETLPSSDPESSDSADEVGAAKTDGNGEGGTKERVRSASKAVRRQAESKSLRSAEVEELFDAYAACCPAESWVTFYGWSNSNGGQLQARWASSNTPGWNSRKDKWLGIGQAGPGKLAALARWRVQNNLGNTPVTLFLDQSDLRGKEMTESQRQTFRDRAQGAMLLAAVFPFIKEGESLSEVKGKNGRYLLGVLSICSPVSRGSLLETEDYQRRLVDSARYLGNALALMGACDDAEHLILRVRERKYTIPSPAPKRPRTKRGSAKPASGRGGGK